MKEITGYSIEKLQELYARNEISPLEVIRSYLDEIDVKDGIIKAFLHICRDEALARAKKLESEKPGSRPLYGIPVAIKDNICTKGIPTTCASKILSGYIPPYDSTAVRKLCEAGAVIIGKTNLDEFAMGSSTEHSAFQITRNPWDEGCAPGGSSGGSAAAVASGMVPAALGSDTGGSIRQPASFCGIVGLKGTYGRVSRSGLVAFASSLDQIGPMTRSVKDSAIMLDVISGRDPLDSTSIASERDSIHEGIDGGVSGMRIGIPSGLGKWDMDEEVRALAVSSAEEFESAGALVREVELPGMDESIACYYVIANAEASSNLARFDGIRYGSRMGGSSVSDIYEETRGRGFGEEVKRRVLLGTYVLSSGYYNEYYGRAQKVRRAIKKNYDGLFSELDLVVLPTTPTPAFRIGEKSGDPLSMYMSDIFTTSANIAGLPAVSIPASLSADGLPLGIQLMAGTGMEKKLLRGALFLEKIYGFRDRYIPGLETWS